MVDEALSLQYGRICNLVVYGTEFDDSQPNGLDLSKLRIKFSVKKSDGQTPNTADIIVYNVEADTAAFIRDNFSPTSGLSSRARGQVILQGGYESNFGVIFRGNIKQVIVGRDSGTDTFMNLVCGDGDRAYNFSILKSSIGPGATAQDQVNAAIKSMEENGVQAGHLGDFPSQKLPRGKVMFGSTRQFLRNIAETTKKSWSIQDEKVTFVGKRTYLPGERVILTSKTGMIGAPQQTNVGVNIKCLMNPIIQISSRVQIDNASIERLKINLAVAGSPANIPAPTTADGVYYVLVAEHQGDTRGVEWYTSLICLNIDATSNPLNSVQVDYGQP